MISPVVLGIWANRTLAPYVKAVEYSAALMANLQWGREMIEKAEGDDE